jgi:hypothetical protein
MACITSSLQFVPCICHICEELAAEVSSDGIALHMSSSSTFAYTCYYAPLKANPFENSLLAPRVGVAHDRLRFNLYCSLITELQNWLG